MLWITIPLGLVLLIASLFFYGAGRASSTYRRRRETPPYGGYVLDPVKRSVAYPAAVLAVVDGLACFFVGGTVLEWWAVSIGLALVVLAVITTATWWYRVSMVGRPALQKKTT